MATFKQEINYSMLNLPLGESRTAPAFQWSISAGRTWELWQRSQLVSLEGLPLLSQENRNENQKHEASSFSWIFRLQIIVTLSQILVYDASMMMLDVNTVWLSVEGEAGLEMVEFVGIIVLLGFIHWHHHCIPPAQLMTCNFIITILKLKSSNKKLLLMS